MPQRIEAVLRPKGVQLNIRKVFLMFGILSVYLGRNKENLHGEVYNTDSAPRDLFPLIPKLQIEWMLFWLLFLSGGCNSNSNLAEERENNS
jgi:hypothetical protein